MSRLDDLIKEKCPNGVKYVELEKVCEITKGRGLSKSDKGTGDIPIILYGELYTTYGNYIDKVVSFASETAKNSLPVTKNDLLLPVSSTTKEAQIGKASVYRLENECYLGGDAIRLRHEQNPGFLMYVINSTAFEKQKMKCVSGTTISHLNPGKLSKIKVPVPPIEVQNEIVQILDNFAELTAELTAELSNRRKQYEYYRDLLLNFDENEQRERVKWVTIGDICDVYTGGEAPEESMKCKSPTGEYSYPIYSNGIGNNAVWGYSKTFRFNQPAITFSSIGTIGHPEIRTEPFTPIIRLKVIIPKSENVDIGYIKYALETADFGLNKSSVPNVNANMIKSIKVCLPDIKKQRQIVNVLNKFDKLVTDISEGLPAEIEARKNQYAYYRDKLLAFEEAK